ncbi:MAG: alpha/beta hydrolase [Gammaproteobacteria bacterium]|jgi:pimeloyl-ACP methyl ester carboxylesterase|nr:alpha/beta hydrolase [Gammaproteobacteria bacterium]
MSTVIKTLYPLATSILFFLLASSSFAQEWPLTPPAEAPADWGPVSANFEEIPYPYPVHYLALKRFGQDMRMAYMDVPPSGSPIGQTVFWQHGMNFYSEAYTPTIQALSAAGFRVIAVDRIGYAKSSKPIIPYQFNFVASNMKALLDELEINEVAIVGHSMGGMVVSRFAMSYPELITHVVMVNQIGLTDQRQTRPWSDPYREGVDSITYQSVLAGHLRYFPGAWPPQHLEYVRRRYGQSMSGEWPRLAMIRRLQVQMLYNDPVVYDWQHITTKALVMGGEEDCLVDNFPELANHVNDELQNSTILLYPGIGHAPQIEIHDLFHTDLIRFLRSDPNEPASEWE